MANTQEQNNTPSIWKNPAFLSTVVAAIIAGIFLLINTFISSSKSNSPTSQQKSTSNKYTSTRSITKDASPTVTHKTNSPVTHRENTGNKNTNNDSPTIESKGDQSPAFVAEEGASVNINY